MAPRNKKYQQTPGSTSTNRRKFSSNSNNSRKNSNRTKKPKIDDDATNSDGHPWRDGDSNSRIHPGSYAHEAQRQRFGVELPKSTTGPSIDISFSLTNNETTAAVPAASGSSGSAATIPPPPPKIVKRKVAMLLGYRGTDYSGFQINEGQRTIQGELELALYKAGLIRLENFGIPTKYGWSTSGRTDKGVHAAAQTISCKVELPLVLPTPSSPPNKEEIVVKEQKQQGDVIATNDPDKRKADTTTTSPSDDKPIVVAAAVVSDEALEQARKRINAALPDAITVMSIIRTTRAFCAKTQRDKVRYHYLLPSFMIDSRTQAILETVIPIAPDDMDNPARDIKNPLSVEEIASLQSHAKCMRSTVEQRNRLQSALQNYIGTHSFHNFTKGVSYKEPRANRYILEFQVHEPVFDDASQTEWIPTTVTGQSFLLHQIRKMIAAAMEMTRETLPEDFIQTAFSATNHVPVPIAPATGLFLEQSWYEGYNRRKNQSGNTNMDVPDLDWTQPGPVLERWKECVASLQKHIIQEEQEQGNFWQYLYIQERMFPKQTLTKTAADASTITNDSSPTTNETVTPSNVDDVASTDLDSR
jgi:tRNA pseudouridine38-40 synthase